MQVRHFHHLRKQRKSIAATLPLSVLFKYPPPNLTRLRCQRFASRDGAMRRHGVEARPRERSGVRSCSHIERIR